MTRWTTCVALLALCMGLATAGGREGQPAAAASTSPHAYFDALVGRSDHWKSYSMRDQAQWGANNWVTYSPATDTDPQAQDAAKVRIPAFTTWQTDKLARAVGPDDLELWLSNAAGDVTKVSTAPNVRGMIVKVGDEYMTAVGGGTNTPYPLTRTGTNAGRYQLASRGSLGSKPQAHAAGTRIQWATNNLPNQVRLPIGTEDGHTYLFTWDGYFTDSYLNTGVVDHHKTFQLSTGTRQRIWLEPQTQYHSTLIDRTTDVASIGHARGYNVLGGPKDWSASTGRQAGPGVTNRAPLRPQLTSSIPLKAGQWARWWVLIEQRANDYEYMSLWVATETLGPVQTYHRLPLSIPPDSQDTIGHFWLEFNTSRDQYRGDLGDLVAYVRNVVVLRDPPPDVTPLLVKPGDTPGHHISAPRPGAPRNLRQILSGPS